MVHNACPLYVIASDSLPQENQDGEPRPSEEEEKEDGRGADDDPETNDTFTSHRRQRAKFLKLFLERASHHRYQQRGTQQAPRLLVGSTGLPEEVHDPPFVDDVVAASESAIHHHSHSLAPAVVSKAPVANTTVVATCRRFVITHLHGSHYKCMNSFNLTNRQCLCLSF